MFRNLRTGRKLLLLCVMFGAALLFTLYGLVAEKRIAIQFATKELAGSRYLAAAREVYGSVLNSPGTSFSAGTSDVLLNVLHEAVQAAGGEFDTTEAEQALASAIQSLKQSPSGDDVLHVLATAKALAQRIGDGSNLTLDPNLDTYYLQANVVSSLPQLLNQLKAMEVRYSDGEDTGTSSSPALARLREEVVRENLAQVEENLLSAYRGNEDGSLRQRLAPSFAAFTLATTEYLKGRSTGQADAREGFRAIAATGIAAWDAAQSDLERLIGERIDDLTARMNRSLLFTGVLGGLSVLLAALTHRYIVLPLERFEAVAHAVRETRDYSLRVEQDSRDEIGRVADAFNDMLSELAAAREREIAEHAEMARMSRLMTVSVMSASIAHEINQPLAAIVANSNAAMRWLDRASPDIDEARAALKRITGDGHRASEIIAGIRTIFRKEGRGKELVDANDLIRDVLLFARGTLQSRDVKVEMVLVDGLPPLLADRVQLQQVLLNLIINAADAMEAVMDRPRRILLKSGKQEKRGVTVSVADNGTGIEATDTEQIFEAFFTTKAAGMGMGLSICRSIVEAHGGRIWSSPRVPYGTVFYVVLPAGKAEAV